MQFLNEIMDKKRLRNVLRECYRQFGTERTAVLIDEIKQLGFAHLTNSGLSWGMDDLQVPPIKKELLLKADEEVQKTYEQFREGLLTESERYNRVVEIWAEVRDKVTDVVSTAGDVIELPVRDSFKEGLSILEYFISTHGSRKGMSDTALRTADAGYLTRRLVDVSQDVVVNHEDCGTTNGLTITKKETLE